MRAFTSLVVAATLLGVAVQREGSRILSVDEEEVLRGNVRVTRVIDQDSPGETGRQTQTVTIDVRLRTFAVLFVEHEGRPVGAFHVMEDRGSEAFGEIGMATAYENVTCDTTNESVSSTGEGGGAAALQGFGGWVYRSLADDDPLASTLDGAYSFQGSARARIGAVGTAEGACGGTDTFEFEASLHVPFVIGHNVIGQSWEPLGRNARSGESLSVSSVGAWIARADTLRQAFADTFRNDVSDPDVRRLAGPTFTGTFSAGSTFSEGRISGSMTTRGNWRIGPDHDEIRAFLTAARADEADYLPRVDDARPYRLRLEDPGPGEVEAVRFILDDVSEHRGIAINTGYHVLVGADATDLYCLHHNAEIAAEPYTVAAPFHGDVIERNYWRHQLCELDIHPDIFFRDVENPEFELLEAYDMGVYSWSTTALLEGIDSDEVIVWAAFNDTAASGRLRAEVRIAGSWYPAAAEGDTATADTTALMLPLDADGDGMHDGWEAQFGVDDPTSDAELPPEHAFRGDGLTVFEEYRGTIVGVAERRLDPNLKTLFVHDESKTLGEFLRALEPTFDREGVELVRLQSDFEFDREVINWTSSDRRGDQYVLVGTSITEGLDQDWSRLAGKAAALGPPRLDANTFVVDLPSRPVGASAYWTGVVGHEIGHQINLPHHGTGDGTIPGEDSMGVYVAVPGGEHSGNVFCFMRYNNARKFCPAPVRHLCMIAGLVDMPKLGQRADFCASAAGTGLNSAGAWAGDASAGNCKSLLRIRSW